MQAALIPDQHKFKYQSTRELTRAVEGAIDSRTEGQYFLYFHGVVDRGFDVVDPELRRVQLRFTVRLIFESEPDAAIVRIIPGSDHSRVGINLYTTIVLKITSIPGHSNKLIAGFGATLLQVPGVRSEEGDQTFGPGTRLGSIVWPSVMIEN